MPMMPQYYKADGTKTDDFIEFCRAANEVLKNPPLWLLGALVVAGVIDVAEHATRPVVRSVKKHINVLRAVL